MPRGGTVRVGVGPPHARLPPPARLPTSSGPEAALGQSGDPGWTGGRARDLSLLLKTPSRAGTLGPGLQEGRVACVPGGVAGVWGDPLYASVWG